MNKQTEVALEFTGSTRILIAAARPGEQSIGPFNLEVPPATRAGDAVLFHEPGRGFVNAAHAVSDSMQLTEYGMATTEFDPDEFYEFDPPVSVHDLPELEKLLKVLNESSSDPDNQPPAHLEGDLREALIRRIETSDTGFREWLAPKPRVWITAGDPKLNSNLQSLQPSDIEWWAVPAKCGHGDYVFLWVNGEGFRYVLRAIGRSRAAYESEPGPHQSRHHVVARLAEPVKFNQLSSDPVLAEWRLVKLSMLGPAKNQPDSILEDSTVWPAFRNLLIGHDSELKPLIDAMEHKGTTTAPNILASRFAGYSRDVPTGAVSDDLLDLHAEFRTLGTILAAKAMEPPLALGLFGEWGSGKSFYIQQIKREVEEIADFVRIENAKKKDSPILFYENTIQIEFNAWHYSDGDLWASLVDHLFTSLRDELRRRRGKDQWAQADKEMRALLSELDSTEQAERAATSQISIIEGQIEDATTRLNTNRTSLEAKEKELANAQRIDAWEGVTMDAVESTLRKQLKDGANEHGYPGLTDDVRRLEAVGQQLKTVGLRSSAIWRSLRTSGLKPWKLWGLLLAVLLAFAAGPVLGVLANHLELEGAELIASIGQALTLLAGVMGWAVPRVSWLSEKLEEAENFLDTVEEASSQVEEELRQNENKHSQTLAKLEGDIAMLRVDLELAQRTRAEAESQKISLIAQMEERQPERMLADFIEERANSKDYREKLGVMALVRRDFERLSDLLLHQRTPGTAIEKSRKKITRKKPEEKLPAIDRIILYIDDLDRCKHSKVVEVLQAVHLLLAYELFIVVVAVDARWVSRSLELEHRQLLVRNGHDLVDRSEEETSSTKRYDKGPHHPPPRTTAADYLEKIFQIPFWLPGFTEGASMRMVDGLLRPQINLEQLKTKEEGIKNDDIVVNIPEPPPRSTDQRREVPPLSLTPEGLELTPNEFNTLVNVAPVAGVTPRQAKRFTNLYRLVKVSLGESELTAFMDEPDSGYRPMAVLLAIVTGAPRAAIEIFELIETLEDETTLAELAGRILWKKTENPDDPLTPSLRRLVTGNPEVELAARKLRAIADSFGSLELAHLRPRIKTIRRYSFDGHQQT